ncbi:capsid protein [Crucivirus-474]|nr:capsid protein [Crucivirus-474]
MAYRRRARYGRRNRRRMYGRGAYAYRPMEGGYAEGGANSFAGTFVSPYDRSVWQRGTARTQAKFGTTAKFATEPQLYNRKLYGFKGLGDYRGFGSRIAKIGRFVKGSLGAIRGFREAYGGRLIGNGDYHGAPNAGAVTTYGEAKDNQLIDGGNAPLTVNSSDDNSGDICFSHREFISNVASPGDAFNITAYALNPALPQTFPFLSQIAKNFTLYEFIGLVMEYVPTSGEFGSANNNLGKVIMATNYDPDAEVFQNSVTMENYDYSVTSKPSLTIRHGIETAPNQQALRMQYTREGPVSRDKIFTDLGLFQIATEGIPEAGIIGELWVTYKIRLSRTQINTGLKASHWTVSNMTTTRPLGRIDDRVEYLNELGLLLAPDPVPQRIFFPMETKGKILMFQFYFQADAGTPIVGEITPNGTLSPYNLWETVASPNQYKFITLPTSSQTAQQSIQCFCFKCDSDPSLQDYIDITWNAIPNGNQKMDFFVIQIDPTRQNSGSSLQNPTQQMFW